jgi:hypothetical protein
MSWSHSATAVFAHTRCSQNPGRAYRSVGEASFGSILRKHEGKPGDEGSVAHRRIDTVMLSPRPVN